MGDYTKITLRVQLDAVGAVAVQRALDASTSPLVDLPQHDFFACARWRTLLQQAKLTVAGGEPTLTIDGKVKNYDGEIRKFCDWVSPSVSCEEHGKVIGSVEVLEFAGPNDVRRLAFWNRGITEIYAAAKLTEYLFPDLSRSTQTLIAGALERLTARSLSHTLPPVLDVDALVAELGRLGATYAHGAAIVALLHGPAFKCQWTLPHFDVAESGFVLV